MAGSMERSIAISWSMAMARSMKRFIAITWSIAMAESMARFFSAGRYTHITISA